MKKILLIMLAIILMTSTVFAESGQVWIEALKNTINVTLNGQKVEADNLLFDGRTYVQLREISNMIGADLTWDPLTSTADLKMNASNNESSTMNSSIRKVMVEGYSNPIASYQDLGVNPDDIYGVAFKDTNEKVSYILLPSGIQILGQFDFGTEIEITIVLKDNTLVKRKLIDGGLAKITQASDPQFIFVPADPTKGFNFPYWIRIPGKDQAVYNTDKKYLFFDMINNGYGKSLEESTDDALETLEKLMQLSVSRSKDFGYPIMMPVVPRTGTNVEQDNFGYTMLYEHALDRASVYVKELTTTDEFAQSNKNAYVNNGVDYQSYYDLDEQIKEMITHAISYLNANGFGLEDQVIMDGYSASGTFTDRFTNLHPESVKMVISGATLDDLMLPTAGYKGEALNFPVGVADYKAITGKAFDLEAHNSVARLIYMGKEDTNNTIDFSDCYFQYTQTQINKLFGNPVLPRAIKNIELYGENGGHGMFILDQGIKHGSSSEMNAFVTEFILANVNSDTPVYPKVTKSNLEATVFE